MPSISWRGSLAIAALVLMADGAAPPRPAPPSTPKLKPTWSVSLKRDGFRKFRRGLINFYGSSYSVACANQSVAVVFDAESGERKNSARVERMLVFNSHTGALLVQRSWPAALVRQMFATARGGYVLRLEGLKGDDSPGGKILALSASGKIVASAELAHDMFVLPSLARKSFLLMPYSPTDGESSRVVDAETLKAMTMWNQPEMERWFPVSFSGKLILAVTHGSGRFGHHLAVARPGKAWQDLGQFDGDTTLLNDEDILLFVPHTLQLERLDASGETKSRYEIPFTGRRHMWLTPGAVSENGSQFVVFFLGQTSIWFSGRWYAYVWDVAKPEPIAFADFKWTAVHSPKFAFCPGGSQLAAVDDGILQVFDLPASGPRAATTNSAGASP